MKKFNMFANATLPAQSHTIPASTDDHPEISKPGPQIDRGEKCRIESFNRIPLEGDTLSGDVYVNDKWSALA